MNGSADIKTLRPLPFPQIRFVDPLGFELHFLILGGLVFYLPFLLYFGEPTLNRDSVAWNIWINSLATAPHTTSTYVRLQRKISEGKVHWFFGLPLFIIGFGALLACWMCGRFLEGITIAATWQAYHYLRQVYGVNRIFAGRNKESKLAARCNFLAFHLAVPLFVFGKSNMLWHVWNGKATDTFIPTLIPDPLMTAFWVIAVAGLLCGLFGEYLKARDNETYNVVGLVILITYFVVHYYGFLSIDYFVRGFLMISIFHAVQYIATVFYLERQGRSESSPLTKLVRLKSTRVMAFPLFWLMLMGIAYCVNQFSIKVDLLWSQFALVFLNSISVHHYGIDSVMWTRKAGK